MANICYHSIVASGPKNDLQRLVDDLAVCIIETPDGYWGEYLLDIREIKIDCRPARASIGLEKQGAGWFGWESDDDLNGASRITLKGHCAWGPPLFLAELSKRYPSLEFLLRTDLSHDYIEEWRIKDGCEECIEYYAEDIRDRTRWWYVRNGVECDPPVEQRYALLIGEGTSSDIAKLRGFIEGAIHGGILNIGKLCPDLKDDLPHEAEWWPVQDEEASFAFMVSGPPEWDARPLFGRLVGLSDQVRFTVDVGEEFGKSLTTLDRTTLNHVIT